MEYGTGISSLAREFEHDVAGHHQPAAGWGATPRRSQDLCCWWCGSDMDEGAVFLTFRRRGQLCCHDCATTLDVPGLYLG